MYPNSSGEECTVICTCCVSLQQWKRLHPGLAGELQEFADMPLYYQVYPNEKINITIEQSGNEVKFLGTIRALHGTPKGAFVLLVILWFMGKIPP